MPEVRFETTVENGTIVIPMKLRNEINGKIEVIIKSKENEGQAEPYDILTELMENPIKDSNFVPFKRDEIYDRKF